MWRERDIYVYTCLQLPRPKSARFWAARRRSYLKLVLGLGVEAKGGEGWTLDFLESPTDPLGGGGWTLDFSESPTDPLGGGGWTLDF